MCGAVRKKRRCPSMGSERLYIMAVQRTYGTVVSVLRAKNIAWNAWPVPGRWSQYRIAVVMEV